MNKRQYVIVKFSKEDRRKYTYHNDDTPIKKGDKVMVRSMEGMKEVIVTETTYQKPEFATKAVIIVPKKKKGKNK